MHVFIEQWYKASENWLLCCHQHSNSSTGVYSQKSHIQALINSSWSLLIQNKLFPLICNFGANTFWLYNLQIVWRFVGVARCTFADTNSLNWNFNLQKNCFICILALYWPNHNSLVFFLLIPICFTCMFNLKRSGDHSASHEKFRFLLHSGNIFLCKLLNWQLLTFWGAIIFLQNKVGIAT